MQRIILYVIYTLQRANVLAVENHFAFQFVPILLDVVVFHHDDHHIHLIQELVKVQNLMNCRCYSFLGMNILGRL